METRSFHFADGKSDKFWTISLDGLRHTVNYGRRGTNGQTQTKEFATDVEARASCDKLIREKTKGGYLENGAAQAVVATSAVSAPMVAPQIVQQPPTSEPQPSPAVQASAPIQPRREVILSDEDWNRATWRPRRRRERPPVLPFNQAEAVERVLKMFVATDRWEFATARAEIPVSMEKREAHFWLEAFASFGTFLHQLASASHGARSHFYERRVELKTAFESRLASLSVSDQLTEEEACRSLAGAPCSSDFLVPLCTLFPAGAAIRVLRQTQQSPERWFTVRDTLFHRLLLPCLTDEDMDIMRNETRQWLISTSWRLQGHGQSTCVFGLAASLGLHDELRKEVRSWRDGLYAQPWSTQALNPQLIVFGLGSADEVRAEFERLEMPLTTPEHIRGWLAHTELSALDYVQHSIQLITDKEESAKLAKPFAEAVIAPEAAPVFLDLMLNSKAPQVAREWLQSHNVEAIYGLLPVVGVRGRTGDAALDFLRGRIRAGDGPIVNAALTASPQLERLRPTLFANEDDLPVAAESDLPPGLKSAFAVALRGRRPKTPDWTAPATLPAIAVSGQKLALPQVELLLAIMSQSELQSPHPLVLAMRCYATPTTVERFAWTLFDRWLTDGAPAKNKWALYALGFFGGDQSSIKLAALIRQWPGEGKHQTAALGLEVLRTIGTDGALMQISGISQKVQFQAIKQRARECMEAIAEDRDLTRDQLEDRVVPTCGLDERGTRVLDFGPRQFRLVLGPAMKPVLIDGDGARKPDLPKPTAKDDAKLAATATEEWKLLKKQVSEVAKVQSLRLEQALVTQRRWTLDEFERLLVNHPLMTNLARLLVWGAFDAEGALQATFRITDDATYANERDESIALPEGATVGLVHPLQITSAQLGAWGELLSDYALVPPFPQLGRAVLGLTPEERHSKVIERHTGCVVPAMALAGTLEKLGWARGAVQDGGSFLCHGKYFPGLKITAVLEHGFLVIGMMDGFEDPDIGKCYFLTGNPIRTLWDGANPEVTLAQVPPIVISEILSDIEQLAAKAKA